MNFMNILNPDGMKLICCDDKMITHERDVHNRKRYIDISKI